MSRQIAIAGAGLLGRLLAWQLSQNGFDITVFDPAPGPQPRSDGKGAAAWTSAGMLSPWAEYENGGEAVFQRGLASIPLWHDITARLSQNLGLDQQLLFKQNGSLLLAHPGDAGSAMRVWSRLPAQPAHAQSSPTPLLNAQALRELEPALAPHLQGWHLPQEAHLTPHAVLQALHADAKGVRWHWGQTVASVEPGCLQLQGGETWRGAWAIDTRGLGSRPALPLRGVRGEIITLHAPGLALSRPVRLLHPRHRVYIVPRPGDQVVVGASEIESEDRSAVSLRSAVELMTAAHSVIPELAEARIIHLETNLRPALPDNQSKLHIEDGLLRINGLFRHGWLLAPSLAAEALDKMDFTKNN